MTDLPKQLNLDSAIKFLPPPLEEGRHKGQAGRIGIIGGSSEYTGAPYFAAMTALRCGADIVYIFCTKDAAVPIKSYAPELIVLPFLDDEHGYDLIVSRLANLHSLIIGPGLGENTEIHSLVLSVIRYIKENGRTKSTLPLILDADGIGLLARNKEMLHDYRAPVYITPNINEMRKLKVAYFGSADIGDGDDNVALQTLVRCVNVHATMILKGQNDRIITSTSAYDCSIAGSSRRIGGQGDILCGSLGLFSYWGRLRHEGRRVDGIAAEIIAAYSACAITKLCNKFAFAQKGRSMITSDMIDQVKNAFEVCFEK